LKTEAFSVKLLSRKKFLWTGRDLNPRPPPCEGGVHTKLNYRPPYIFVKELASFKISVNNFLINMVNVSFPPQQLDNI
jgi:hypothetical protein